MSKGHPSKNGVPQLRCSCGQIVDARGAAGHLKSNDSHYIVEGPKHLVERYGWNATRSSPKGKPSAKPIKGDTMRVRFCPQCRTPVGNLDSVKFCPACGEDMHAVVEALANAVE